MCFRLFLSAAVTALCFAMSPLVQAQDAAEPLAIQDANLPAWETSAGKVTYYGHKHAGRKTASGERFNPNALTMAHRTLPFGTLVRVTNLHNNQSVVVRVNDRGPVSRKHVGDLTSAAASKISMLRAGVADVLLEIVSDILPGKDGKS